MINFTKPSIVTGYNDERFETQDDAIECAEWMENESGKDDETLYVFEKDGEWVVAW